MGSFLYTWKPGDIKAEFRITYKIEPSEPTQELGAATVGTVDNIRFSLQSIHFLDEDGVGWLPYYDAEIIPVRIMRCAEDRICCEYRLGKLDVEALCLADYESEKER